MWKFIFLMGVVLSGPRGAQVGEFFKAVEFSAPVVAAIVNDDLHELTYPIEIELTSSL